MTKRLLLVPLALLLFATTSRAQQFNLTGRVMSDSGEPLVGASVIIEGSQTGVATDSDGNFSITVSPGSSLTANYMGYKPQTLPVSGKAPLYFTLESAANQMDEVVVVGYGTQRRSDISTAMASVNINTLNKSGSAQTLEALQGKVAGVQIISNDGSLTSGLTFRIRGINSVTGGTQPLFVIDGVPLPPQQVTNSETSNNPLLGLNPNDIASMEILKDASAAAIYGADGANGVVLITTKQGKRMEQAHFQISAKAGLDFKPNNPFKVLSPEEYAHKMLVYGSFEKENVLAFWNDVINTKAWNDSSLSHVWLDEIQQTAKKYEVNASMSGGSKKMTYMFSAGYVNNQGILKRSSFDRFTSRLNLAQDVGSKVKISTNLSFSTSREKNPITDWTQSGLFLKAIQITPYLYYPGFADLMEYEDLGRMSPLVAINERDLDTNYNELSGKLNFEYDIIKGLVFNTSFSFRRYDTQTTGFFGPNTWFGVSEKGRMELEDKFQNNWVYEARLQYSKSIQKHYFSVMGAFEAKKWWQKQIYNKATNFEDTTLGIWGINQGLVTFAPNYGYDDNTTASFLGRLTYTYDDKYVLNASFRADGSSRFGDNNKFGYFPAVSVAWRASEEKFIKDVNWISNLRLRASFGVTGNNQFPSYQSLSTLGSNKVVMNGNQIEIGKVPDRVANSDLKWETSKQYNAGLDFSVLDNRLSLTADFYYKRIDDMLLEVNIPSTSGYNTAWKNAGAMMNKGMEYTLNAVLLDGKFKWSMDFNIAFNRNKILSLDDGQYQQFYSRGINEKMSNDVVLRIGLPVGIYYGYICDGVYNNENEVVNGYPGSNLDVGQLKVVDVNGDGKIDQNDRIPLANVNPVHTGGIGTNLSYKGFDLYAFFRWSYGNDQINGNAYYITGANNSDNLLKSVYPYVWSETTPGKNYPLYGTGKWGESVFRSEVVEDGSFLRLQTLTIGYTFPQKWLSKIGIDRLRLSATGNNLFLWTRYSGFDPEANTGWGTVARLAPGLDMSPYPRPRSFSIALEIGF